MRGIVGKKAGGLADARHIQERVTRRTTKLPLLWWKVNEAKFPNVAKVARRLLCIIGTSVSSERVFSIAGLTVTNNRSQLDSACVDQIIFMNKALRRKYNEKRNKAVDIPHEISVIKEEPSEPKQEPNMDDDEPMLPALY